MGYLPGMQVPPVRRPQTVHHRGEGLPLPSPKQTGSEPTLDAAILASLRELLDAGIVAGIYREFLAQTQARLTSLEAPADPKHVCELAHTIKGTAGMLGAKAIAACAAELEDGPGSPEHLRRQVDRLGEACRALDAALRQERVLL